MTQKFSDVARAELAADITDVATSFTIDDGGALFPVADTGAAAIGPGKDWFKVTLVDDDGYEIVYVRTHEDGSTTFSDVLRGQEGTTARAFDAVHSVSGRATVVGLRVSSVDFDRFEAKEPPIAAGTTAQYWRGDKTWRDFATDVRGAVLTGLSTATNAVVAATDTVLQAIGKLQKQITDHLAAKSNPHEVTKSQVGLGNVDNVSAANLRDRSTHTGTQAASTITGLATVATSGSYNDLTDTPSIPAGTVTSVGMSVPTGLQVSGSPVTSSGTLEVSFASGYAIPTTEKQSNWDTAYEWGNHASAGYAPTASPTFTGTVTLPATVMGDAALDRAMLKGCGFAYYNSGSTSSLDYTNGSHQRWAPSGSATLTVTNWPPSGNLGELLIEGINLGAATITWPTVNWVLSDGTTSTTFADTEVELQASGTDWILLWTRDAGTTVYGKVMR